MLNLQIPNFFHVTMAEYQGSTKDPKNLYFIKGTSLIYKGDAIYGTNVKKVSALPAAQDAIAEMVYIVTGENPGVFALNPTKDGFDSVVEKDYFNNVSYDGAKAELKLTKADGTEVVINLPKENFLSTAKFDAPTNKLIMQLVDGTEFDLDLSELIDTYTVEDTATVKLTMDANGKISADVKVSANSQNALQKKADGLFVPKPSTAINESSTDDEAASSKAVYSMLKQMEWKESV